jgi:hypothetical protein
MDRPLLAAVRAVARAMTARLAAARAVVAPPPAMRLAATPCRSWEVYGDGVGTAVCGHRSRSRVLGAAQQLAGDLRN